MMVPRGLAARLAAWRVRPGALVWQPPPPAGGDPARARRLARGVLLLDGRLVESQAAQPWDITPPDAAWSDALHGHGWLDDAAAADDPALWPRFEDWVWGWIDRYGAGGGPGWRADLVARRLSRWIACSIRLLRGRPPERSRAFFRAMAGHARYLGWRWRETHGAARIEALGGLVYATLSMEGDGRAAARAVRLLGREAAAVVGPDGIASRNPEELARIVRVLCWSAEALGEAGMTPADGHLVALRRAVPVLRALGVPGGPAGGGGALARFHGGRAGLDGGVGGPDGWLDAALDLVLPHGDQRRVAEREAGAGRPTGAAEETPEGGGPAGAAKTAAAQAAVAPGGFAPGGVSAPAATAPGGGESARSGTASGAAAGAAAADGPDGGGLAESRLATDGAGAGEFAGAAYSWGRTLGLSRMGAVGMPGTPGDPRVMGYLRMAAGDTVLVLDAASPPGGRHAASAHASALAFEMWAGGQPLVVSRGSGLGFGAPDAVAARGAAAHSTVGLAGRSPGRLRPAAGAPRLETTGGVALRMPGGPGGGRGPALAESTLYLDATGLAVERRLEFSADGGRLSGEDTVVAPSAAARARVAALFPADGPPCPVAARFHLHPDVRAEMALAGRAVALALPDGTRWLLRAGDAALELLPSRYYDEARAQPRATMQVVASTALAEYWARVAWTLERVGEAGRLRPLRLAGRAGDGQTTRAGGTRGRGADAAGA